MSRAQFHTLCGIGWLSCQLSAPGVVIPLFLAAMATLNFVVALLDKGDKP